MKLERSSTLEEEPRLLDAAKVEQTTTPSEGTGDTTLQEKTILPENSKEERDIFEELYVDRPVLMNPGDIVSLLPEKFRFQLVRVPVEGTAAAVIRASHKENVPTFFQTSPAVWKSVTDIAEDTFIKSGLSEVIAEMRAEVMAEKPDDPIKRASEWFQQKAHQRAADIEKRKAEKKEKKAAEEKEAAEKKAAEEKKSEEKVTTAPAPSIEVEKMNEAEGEMVSIEKHDRLDMPNEALAAVWTEGSDVRVAIDSLIQDPRLVSSIQKQNELVSINVGDRSINLTPNDLALGIRFDKRNAPILMMLELRKDLLDLHAIADLLHHNKAEEREEKEDKPKEVMESEEHEDPSEDKTAILKKVLSRVASSSPPLLHAPKDHVKMEFLHEVVSSRGSIPLRKAAKDSDDYFRRRFARDNKRNSVDLGSKSLNLIDVHSSEALFEWSLPSKDIPLVLDDHIIVDLTNTTPRPVVSKESFITRFDAFSNGSLDGADWSNMVVAGGAVVACLKSTPTPGGEANFETIMEDLYTESDIDIFLYGVTPGEANAKLAHLYKVICRNHDSKPLVVRTNNAITFCCDYPMRHVQVVLRIYRSPAEISMGFDVDCCAVVFDGKDVFAAPRAVLALREQVNVIDLSRRSYTYETRLLKYAQRGFAIGVPGLRRAQVNPTIYHHKFNEVQGLSRLLLLEYKYRKQAGVAFDLLTGEQAGARPGMGRRNKYQGAASIGDIHVQLLDDRYLDRRRVDFENKEHVRVEEYNAVFLPWGPDWDGKSIEELLIDKYNYLNAGYDRSANVRICPCFFAWELKGVLEDVWHASNQRTQEDDRYVLGAVKWLTENPGRQMIGSFHPHEDDDWDQGAYRSLIPETSAATKPEEKGKKRKVIVLDDDDLVDHVEEVDAMAIDKVSHEAPKRARTVYPPGKDEDLKLKGHAAKKRRTNGPDNVVGNSMDVVQDVSTRLRELLVATAFLPDTKTTPITSWSESELRAGLEAYGSTSVGPSDTLRIRLEARMLEAKSEIVAEKFDDVKNYRGLIQEEKKKLKQLKEEADVLTIQATDAKARVDAQRQIVVNYRRNLSLMVTDKFDQLRPRSMQHLDRLKSLLLKINQGQLKVDSARSIAEAFVSLFSTENLESFVKQSALTLMKKANFKVSFFLEILSEALSLQSRATNPKWIESVTELFGLRNHTLPFAQASQPSYQYYGVYNALEGKDKMMRLGKSFVRALRDYFDFVDHGDAAIADWSDFCAVKAADGLLAITAELYSAINVLKDKPDTNMEVLGSWNILWNALMTRALDNKAALRAASTEPVSFGAFMFTVWRFSNERGVALAAEVPALFDLEKLMQMLVGLFESGKAYMNDNSLLELVQKLVDMIPSAKKTTSGHYSTYNYGSQEIHAQPIANFLGAFIETFPHDVRNAARLGEFCFKLISSSSIGQFVNALWERLRSLTGQPALTAAVDQVCLLYDASNQRLDYVSYQREQVCRSLIGLYGLASDAVSAAVMKRLACVPDALGFLNDQFVHSHPAVTRACRHFLPEIRNEIAKLLANSPVAAPDGSFRVRLPCSCGCCKHATAVIAKPGFQTHTIVIPQFCTTHKLVTHLRSMLASAQLPSFIKTTHSHSTTTITKTNTWAQQRATNEARLKSLRQIETTLQK